MNGLEHGMQAGGLLELAARRVEAGTGLQFGGPRRRQFHAALERMAETLGQPGAEACAAWLADGEWDDARCAACARFLTIGETYFFREPRALDLACELARAHLARGEFRPFRIWSAGCCTGEEPYSIAMALRRRVPQLAPAMVSILATDLNESFLEFARAGAYRRWSFRQTDPADHAAFFRPLDDGRFGIDPALRAQVRFARLNLAGAGYPSAATGTLGLDLIFCRNVLMYFSRAQARAVVARLRDCLADGGWLVVNASEASTELFAGFTPVVHEDAVYFRKDGGHAGAAPAFMPAPDAAPAFASAAAAARGFGGARAQAPDGAAARAFDGAPARALDSVPARGFEDVPAPADDFAPAHPQAPAGRGTAAAPPGPGETDARPDPMARARSLLEQGSRDEALQCLRRAVEAEPLSLPLQRSAALFAFEHGDRALARDGVKRLLYLEPDSALGHYLAALIEEAEGRHARALQLLQESRRLAAAGTDDELGGAVAQWLGRLQ